MFNKVIAKLIKQLHKQDKRPPYYTLISLRRNDLNGPHGYTHTSPYQRLTCVPTLMECLMFQEVIMKIYNLVSFLCSIIFLLHLTFCNNTANAT